MTRPTYNDMNVDEYAWHYVKDLVDRGQTVRQSIEGQHGRFGKDLRLQVGGYRAWNREWSEVLTPLRLYELFVMIGDEWKVFNLHKLFEEARSGVRQGTLL